MDILCIWQAMKMCNIIVLIDQNYIPNAHRRVAISCSSAIEIKPMQMHSYHIIIKLRITRIMKTNAMVSDQRNHINWWKLQREPKFSGNKSKKMSRMPQTKPSKIFIVSSNQQPYKELLLFFKGFLLVSFCFTKLKRAIQSQRLLKLPRNSWHLRYVIFTSRDKH